MKVRLKPINEQVVVLVGATSGIGLETAMHMAGKGAQVVIVGRSQEGLNDALEQVRSHAEESMQIRMRGRNGSSHQGMTFEGMANAEMNAAPVADMEDQVIALEGDVTNFDQLKSVADQVIQRFGRIDTWVNVAAVSEWALFEDTSPDEFHRIIEVNLLGQAYGAMAVLPYLRQQDGSALIFVASIAGRVPIPYQSAYNASKHGILGLVDTLRQELRHTGAPVSITAILPASINTPLFEKARTKIGVEPEPIRPVYDAQMVAKAITYAAQTPVRELIVGDAGYMMTFMRRLAPTLTSNFLGATGFRQQRSNEIKSAQAPDNLYHHMSGYDEVQGEYKAKPFSALTWLSTHPKVRMAIYGSLIAGAGALVGWRIVKARSYRRSWRYQLPRQAKKFSKQAGKAADKAFRSTGKVFRNTGEKITALPVVSNMPMFRKKSFLERVGETALGWWAAITAIQLPFVRRKSWVNRMTDRLPNVNVSMPWKDADVDRLTMRDQRKAAASRFAKASTRVMKKAEHQGKKVSKAAEKTMDRAKETGKDAMKAAAKQAPSKNDMKEMMQSKPVVVRKQSFVEKLPFGERRETIVERVPVKK